MLDKHEGHSGVAWSYPDALDELERTVGWFDTYLKGESPDDR